VTDFTISERTIKATQKLITGEGGLSPYRSGPQLVEFFNEFGSNDTYSWGGGFPSRWVYAEDKLRGVNGSPAMARVLPAVVDPRTFHNTEFSEAAAVEHLNEYLEYDGLKLVKEGLSYRLASRLGAVVIIEAEAGSEDPISQEFIHDQVEKCGSKLATGDYDGAITNARSLLEAVLVEMERRISGGDPATDGDLGKLYKRVTKLLNLDPNKKGLDAAFVEILRGFISIVNGLASLRNTASDAHARSYRPEQHHARLAVNTAKTVVDFLFETYEYQKRTGKIAIGEPV
jgi:hypothetical protein